MPCGLFDVWYGPPLPEKNQPDYRKMANELTRLLCSACRRMEREGVKLPRDLACWWKTHKAADAARRKASA